LSREQYPTYQAVAVIKKDVFKMLVQRIASKQFIVTATTPTRPFGQLEFPQ
jgi:hypothetical protein